LVAALLGVERTAFAEESAPAAPPESAGDPPPTVDRAPAAEPSAAATRPTTPAQVLFRDGKRLMEQLEYEEACPKLAESFRLEPETGTLLTTALCYERAGQFASAVAAYNDAAKRASLEGSADRATLAQTKAMQLAPRVSKLVVEVKAAARVPGLVVTRDGVPVGEDSWGIAVPVDPGDHWVEARAPGKRTYTAHGIAAGPGFVVLQVPALGELKHEALEAEFWTPLRKVGLVVGGVGVVTLGIGGYFGAHALSLKSDSDRDCNGNVCGARGFDDRNSARSAGNTSTALVVTGALLAAGGVTLFVLGAPDAPETVSLAALNGGGSLELAGSF
jgi:hypothetical protein